MRSGVLSIWARILNIAGYWTILLSLKIRSRQIDSNHSHSAITASNSSNQSILNHIHLNVQKIRSRSGCKRTPPYLLWELLLLRTRRRLRWFFTSASFVDSKIKIGLLWSLTCSAMSNNTLKGSTLMRSWVMSQPTWLHMVSTDASWILSSHSNQATLVIMHALSQTAATFSQD